MRSWSKPRLSRLPISRWRCPIAAEEAETASSQGRDSDAAAAWTTALDRARSAGLKADGVSAMLRRRAAAYVGLDRIEDAGRDYDEAYRLTDVEHGSDVAGFVRIEQARALLDSGHAAEAERVVSVLDPLNASEHLLAEIFVLRAKLERQHGHADKAISYATRARTAALAAVAPLSYFAASAELADILQWRGERTQAYGILATTLATLSDVLGKEVARSWVLPIVSAYQALWGGQSFNDAKSQYESERRAQKGTQ